MSDVVSRKKKNADAQAAFRARRANYIATLEETVTTLESVVIQLQDSCRESRKEAADLRDENCRLRHEYNERERMWRAFAHARKTGQATDADLPPPMLSSFTGDVQSNALSPPLMQHQLFPTSVPYRGDAVASQSTFPSSSAGSSFSGSSSTVSFASSEVPTDGPIPHRVGRYAPYPYPMQGSRDQRWNGLPTNMSNGGSVASPHSQSPAYVESPSLTSADMSAYPTRFSGGDEQQKAALNSVLENAPYVFPNGDRFHQPVGESIPNSRSISPTATSTPSSSTSMSLTSSFPYTFAESSTTHEHADFDYRRHSLPHCPEVTLHGGTADISLTGQAPDLRYRMDTSRRPDSGADQQKMSPSENSAHQDGSSDGDQPYNGSRAESRRYTISNHSGSPSPGPAPISCTVAVIKAQAFGALRRTRAKTKKTSEGAARVTKGVLEARGIGIDGPAKTKRPRLDDEYGNTETP